MVFKPHSMWRRGQEIIVVFQPDSACFTHTTTPTPYCTQDPQTYPTYDTQSYTHCEWFPSQSVTEGCVCNEVMVTQTDRHLFYYREVTEYFSFRFVVYWFLVTSALHWSKGDFIGHIQLTVLKLNWLYTLIFLSKNHVLFNRHVCILYRSLPAFSFSFFSYSTSTSSFSPSSPSSPSLVPPPLLQYLTFNLHLSLAPSHAPTQRVSSLQDLLYSLLPWDITRSPSNATSEQIMAMALYPCESELRSWPLTPTSSKSLSPLPCLDFTFFCPGCFLWIYRLLPWELF